MKNFIKMLLVAFIVSISSISFASAETKYDKICAYDYPVFDFFVDKNEDIFIIWEEKKDSKDDFGKSVLTKNGEKIHNSIIFFSRSFGEQIISEPYGGGFIDGKLYHYDLDGNFLINGKKTNNKASSYASSEEKGNYSDFSTTELLRLNWDLYKLGNDLYKFDTKGVYKNGKKVITLPITLNGEIYNYQTSVGNTSKKPIFITKSGDIYFTLYSDSGYGLFKNKKLIKKIETPEFLEISDNGDIYHLTSDYKNNKVNILKNDDIVLEIKGNMSYYSIKVVNDNIYYTLSEKSYGEDNSFTLFKNKEKLGTYKNIPVLDYVVSKNGNVYVLPGKYNIMNLEYYNLKDISVNGQLLCGGENPTGDKEEPKKEEPKKEEEIKTPINGGGSISSNSAQSFTVKVDPNVSVGLDINNKEIVKEEENTLNFEEKLHKKYNVKNNQELQKSLYNVNKTEKTRIEKLISKIISQNNNKTLDLLYDYILKNKSKIKANEKNIYIIDQFMAEYQRKKLNNVNILGESHFWEVEGWFIINDLKEEYEETPDITYQKIGYVNLDGKKIALRFDDEDFTYFRNKKSNGSGLKTIESLRFTGVFNPAVFTDNKKYVKEYINNYYDFGFDAKVIRK